VATTGAALEEPATGNVVSITININAKGEVESVEPNSFQISKSRHQQILWRVSDPAAHFNVSFDEDSPFEYTQFSDVEPYSGLVRREVLGDPNKYYSYRVTVTPANYEGKKGSQAFDPGGVVNP
jgi:hypothetical protein